MWDKGLTKLRCKRRTAEMQHTCVLRVIQKALIIVVCGICVRCVIIVFLPEQSFFEVVSNRCDDLKDVCEGRKAMLSVDQTRLCMGHSLGRSTAQHHLNSCCCSHTWGVVWQHEEKWHQRTDVIYAKCGTWVNYVKITKWILTIAKNVLDAHTDQVYGSNTSSKGCSICLKREKTS